MSFGMGGPNATRVTGSTGRIQGGFQLGMQYPNPFFDVAHTYLPRSVRDMFRWCRYYFLTSPLINAAVFKLSEYPVTDVVIQHPNEETRQKWLKFLNKTLRIRFKQIEGGLDYQVYGNSLFSVSFPFIKYLTCIECKVCDTATNLRPHWQITNYQFRLTCPKCKQVANAKVQDKFIRNPAGIRLLRWNPEDVETSYNDITGDQVYYYNLPASVKNDIVLGRKEVIEKIPQLYLQSVAEQKSIVFQRDGIFHMKRPTLAQVDRGWGTPPMLPLLKDLFQLQVLRKAQETICLEHILPLRVMFPQAGSGSADPYCVSPDTLVETVGGLQPASEVRTGDFLRSHMGAWRRVEAVKSRSVRADEKVFRVKAASLAAFPFEASEDHPLLAVRRSHRHRGRQVWVDPEFIPVESLAVGDYVAYPCGRTVSNIASLDLANYVDRGATDRYVYRRLSQGAAEAYEWLEENADPAFGSGERMALLAEKGWLERDFVNAQAMRYEGKIERVDRFVPLGRELATLVGYFLAEGCARNSLPNFALHANEGWIGDEIEAAASKLGFHGTSRYHRPEQNGLYVEVQDVLLGEFLVGLCGKGFAGKRIPQEFSEASDAVVLRMLQCLFAGDGCDFRTATNRVALKLANPSMLLEARRILLSFGVIGGTVREDPTETSLFRTPAFHLNYNGPQAEAMRTLLSTNAPLPQPIGDVSSGVIRNGYVLLRIASMEEVKVPTVIGFQMHGDKSFCVAGVATHNTSIDLGAWKDQVAQEVSRWKLDRNYIPILPLPIGNQTIGGDGRAMMLTGEIESASGTILAGLGVPKEFLFGGLTWSGGNASMRLLENSLLRYMEGQCDLLNWVIQQVASFMEWPLVEASFKPFKMADDLQRKSFDLQLNQMGKLSDTTLMAGSDYDAAKENSIMETEAKASLKAQRAKQISQAEIQGEVMLITSKYQAKAQAAMQPPAAAAPAPGEPGAADPTGGGTPGGQEAPPEAPPAEGGPPTPQPGQPPEDGADPLQQMQSPLGMEQRGGGVDILMVAQTYARAIKDMPPDAQAKWLANLESTSPDLVSLVQKSLASMGVTPGPVAGGVDTRPMPEMLPPRRAG